MAQESSVVVSLGEEKQTLPHCPKIMPLTDYR
jgi:hypothetical protein